MKRKFVGKASRNHPDLNKLDLIKLHQGRKVLWVRFGNHEFSSFRSSKIYSLFIIFLRNLKAKLENFLSKISNLFLQKTL